MAEKRMFTKKIVDSDAFLDMPLSTQCLYFHLNMRADDDGFINNPKKIARMIGASEDDLKLLIAKRFTLAFESGVIVIKHWRMHNLLRKDRYNATQYQEEYQLLELKDNGSYTERTEALATTWQPNGNQMATEDRIGKDSIGEDSINKKSARTRFVHPSVEEVAEYIREKGYSVDAEAFIDYYESNGWKVGRQSMKDWKAAVRTWERRKENDYGNDHRTGNPVRGRISAQDGRAYRETQGSGTHPRTKLPPMAALSNESK